MERKPVLVGLKNGRVIALSIDTSNEERLSFIENGCDSVILMPENSDVPDFKSVYEIKFVDKATPEGFVLDAPARVGGGVFQEGVKWSTVIESAQRLYEYSKDEIKPIVSPADMLKIACGDLVLVPKEKIGSLVGELHTAFQSTPTLTLGDLLPLQQDFQAMIEAQEQSHD